MESGFPKRSCPIKLSHDPEDSAGRLHAVDFRRACLDPRNELAAEFDGIVERIEAAHQNRTDAELVIFQDRTGDLLRRADETRWLPSAPVTRAIGIQSRSS